MALGKFKSLFKDVDDDETLTGTEDEFYNISEADALAEADKSGNKMILLEPRAYSESQQIADHLKNRNSVVVNLKSIYAIGGTMQKIGVGIYLCTPKNVNVQGKISDESEKNKADVEEEW